MSNFSFGIKISIGGRKHNAGAMTYLRNIDGEHNKYYHISLIDVQSDKDFPYRVQIDFGRFGGAGSRKNHKFKESIERANFMEKTLKQKLAKGYKHYSPGIDKPKK